MRALAGNRVRSNTRVAPAIGERHKQDDLLLAVFNARYAGAGPPFGQAAIWLHSPAVRDRHHIVTILPLSLCVTAVLIQRQ